MAWAGNRALRSERNLLLETIEIWKLERIDSSPIIVPFSLRFFFPSFFIPSAIPLNIHRDRND